MVDRLGRPRNVLLVAGLVVALAGCGGGITIGLGYGDDLDRPPSVALTVSVNEALPGAVVRLAAAAVDDVGIVEVVFLRLADDGSFSTLATDRTSPYELDITLPVAPTGTVLRYVARATDTVRQSRDSEPVGITVR